MEVDNDVPLSGSQCIKKLKKIKTKVKSEGLSWKNSNKLFGLMWQIGIWSL